MDVRVAHAPEAERVGLLAWADIAPSRFDLAVIHAVADDPGHGDLAGQQFAADLAPQRAGEDVAVFLDFGHHFSPGEKKARGQRAINGCSNREGAMPNASQSSNFSRDTLM